jgi:hypothetical protein
MNPKELCMKLAYCDKEQGVISLLKAEGYWDNPNVWRYYGDNENNFATIGNQKNRPEDAITEKIINSVDAVLMAFCLAEGIDPESKAAPQSIHEALIKYFNIYDGKLSNITASERQKLAENISLVATGEKSNPCYSIIDKGEGQSPDRMPDTLLSLGKSNKLRIPFVQGKFNMGGTGAFQFCGEHNLQLIISKRHPEIARHENGNASNDWGFTIVRRENPTKGIRSSVYKYLAPNGKILSFAGDGLPLLPGEYPIAYQKEIKWGTFIKLYEYQMSGGLKTNIKFDLYYRLSLLMPAIALPVRLYERREGYTGHTQETTLSGLTVRLEEDKRENLEEEFQIPGSSTLSAQGQKMRVSIYAFKREQSEKYLKNEGIIFVINGQTHGYLSKSFFAHEKVKLGYLKDSLIAIVDSSDFDGRAREDLFMNSRDRLRDCALLNHIEKNLADLLRNHSGLRELNTRRRQEDIKNRLEDSKPLAEVIENILKRSPTLSRLFVQGVRLPNPFVMQKAKQQKEFIGKRFPTYFRITNEYPKDNPKECPINVRPRVQFKTDASNDYFDRDSERGSFTLKVNGDEIKDFSLNLWNGFATLSVVLPGSVKVGDKLRFESAVEDVSRVEPFTNEFFVDIVEAIKKNRNGGKGGKRKRPDSEDEGEEVERPSYLDLPNVTKVRRSEWGKYGFDAESALKVVDSDKGYDFFVNMDNIHLQTEQKVTSTIDPKLLEARYEYGMVLIGLAFLRDSKCSNNKERDTTSDDMDICDKIIYVTRAISPILLPMISGLGDLDVADTKITNGEN